MSQSQFLLSERFVHCPAFNKARASASAIEFAAARNTASDRWQHVCPYIENRKAKIGRQNIGAQAPVALALVIEPFSNLTCIGSNSSSHKQADERADRRSHQRLSLWQNFDKQHEGHDDAKHLQQECACCDKNPRNIGKHPENAARCTTLCSFLQFFVVGDCLVDLL